MMDMGYNRKFILEDGEEYYGFAFGYTGGNSAVIDPLGEPLTFAGEAEVNDIKTSQHFSCRSHPFEGFGRG